MKYNVMINRTRSIEQSVEIEVTATDEADAQEKAIEKISTAIDKGRVEKAFDWETSNDDDEFEYEVSEV